MRRLSILLVMALVISIFSGCGISIPTGDGGKINLSKDKIEVTSSDGEKGSVSLDQDNGSISVETEDGKATYSSSTELPKEWPLKVIPIIDDGKILSSSKIDSVVNGTPSQTLNLLFDVDQPVSDVVDFYTSSLNDAEDFTKFTSEEMGTLSGIKDNIQFMFYIAPNDDGGSEVSITINVSKE